MVVLCCFFKKKSKTEEQTRRIWAKCGKSVINLTKQSAGEF